MPRRPPARWGTRADGTQAQVGTLGTIGTFSFYPSKNLGAFGDGGAITTADPALAEQVRLLRFHGSRAKDTYLEVGYNSRLDAIQAAILGVLLPHLPTWVEHRRAAGARYPRQWARRARWPARGRARLRAGMNLWVVTHPEADRLAEGLAAQGIEARAYYRQPVHLQPAMAPWATNVVDLPGTDLLAAQHLALPISAAITDEQIDRVVAAVGELL